MMPNLHLNRMPVEEPKKFYGRRREVRQIIETIGGYRPGSVSLVGYRRIGKTSTLRFIQNHKGALNEFAPLLWWPREKYLFVFVDLEVLRIGDVADDDEAAIRFLRRLLDRLHRAVTKRVAEPGFLSMEKATELRQCYRQWVDTTNTYALATEGLEDYLHKLTEEDVVVVMLLDEADAVVRRGFGLALRSLVATLPLAYVIATQKPLHELDAEKDLSPLYNLCTLIPLGLLDDDAARALVAESAEAAELPFSPAELAFILRLGGGHPDFLRVAATHVFAAKVEGKRPSCLDDLTPVIAKALEGSCISILRGIDATEKALVRQIAEGRPPRNLPPMTATWLIERGLAVWEAGRMRLFSPIFQAHVLSEAATESTPTTLVDGRELDGERVLDIVTDAKLTPLEQRILDVLEEHAGQPVSRQEIYERAWQDGKYEERRDATITVAMQRLRGKLKSQFQNRIRIEAARKEGYSLVT